ncbi:MFS transporter [Ascidiimonas aurantiaca]|uniref:MFS transporter n=1 Tax=Ascidiimonas aurantiaca TaxID=1685432 RepID=UPI0030EB5447
MSVKPPPLLIVYIVTAQFFCTSLWFAGNAVISDLIDAFGFDIHALGHITAAVQLGFITGTLFYALFTIADRFSPSKVFMWSAFAASISNILMILEGHTLTSMVILRFLTGFFLAGIYPVGMKIAADYYEKGLGKALGYLVGALVLGTALPHLLKGISLNLSWKTVISTTSALSIIGGLCIGLGVKDGPYRKPGTRLHFNGLRKIFRNKDFLKPALGYFGHMWELYAFWAFVPLLLEHYETLHQPFSLSVSLVSFGVIAIGAIGCVSGGYLSLQHGEKKVARIALILSGICCLLAPLAIHTGPWIFFSYLTVWGIAVITDSPLFSTLVAKNATPELKGTSLTLVNCIGFSLTILSIELISFTLRFLPITYVFLLLVPGPVLGSIALWRK